MRFEKVRFHRDFVSRLESGTYQVTLVTIESLVADLGDHVLIMSFALIKLW